VESVSSTKSSDSYKNRAQLNNISLASPSSSSSSITSSPTKLSLIKTPEISPSTPSITRSRSRLMTNGNLLILKTSKSSTQMDKIEDDVSLPPPSPTVAQFDLIKQLNEYLNKTRQSISQINKSVDLTPLQTPTGLLTNFEKFVCEVDLSNITNRMGIESGKSKFIGRGWVFNDIERFVSSQESVFIIEGSIGSGKTRICEEIMLNSSRKCDDYLFYTHFCQVDDEETLDSLQFVRNLIKLMYKSEQNYQYREYLSKNTHLIDKYYFINAFKPNINFLKLKEMNYLFEKCFLEPLNLNQQPKRTYLIVIDQLDACFSSQLNRYFNEGDYISDKNDGIITNDNNSDDDDDGDEENDDDIAINNLGVFLVKNIHKFPKNFKFLITFRTNLSFKSTFTRTILHKNLQNLLNLKNLNLSLNDNSKFDLMLLIQTRISESENLKKNLYYFQTNEQQQVNAKLELSIQNKFIDYVLNISIYSFLFIDLILNLIEQNLIQIKTLKFNNIPKTLNDLFQLIFNLNFSIINTISSNKYLNEANIIIIALISLKPLNINQIFQILCQNEENNDDCLSNDATNRSYYKILLQNLSNYFLNIDDTTNKCKFHHLALRDWLYDKLKYSNKQIQFKKFSLKLGYYLYSLYLYKKLVAEINIDDKTVVFLSWEFNDFLFYLLNSQFNTTSKIYFANLVLTSIKSRNLNVESFLTNFNIILNRPSRLVFRFLLKNVLKLEAFDNICVKFSNNSTLPLLFVYACFDYKNMFQVAFKIFKKGLNLVNLDTNMSIISYACDYNSVEFVKNLLKSIDFNTLFSLITSLDKTNSNSLLYAAKNGNIDVIECIFDKFIWPSLDMKVICINQVCVVAAMYNQYALVEYLVDKFFVSGSNELNIDAVDTLKGETALAIACTYGNINICKLLITKANASLLQANSKSLTPLLCAIKTNEWKVVEYLLNNYVNLELLEQQVDKHNRTALMIAASEGHLAIIDILIEKGVNLSGQDCEGLTALGWACLKGHYNAVINLLNNGSNINQTDFSGRTPLDLATFYGDCRLVRILFYTT
jgi:ankyrin repeat protein